MKETINKTTHIEDVYIVPKGYIKTIALASEDDEVCGFIWESEPGMGKSTITQNTLSELGKEFVVISGRVTPLRLYKELHKNNGKIIVLDDVSGIMHNEISMNIIMLATWHIGGKRIISYRTTRKLVDIPESFEFLGKIIILTNENLSSNAGLASRCLCFRTQFPFWKKIEIMKNIAHENGISDDVISYIDEMSSQTTKNLSIRTLIRVNAIKENAGKNWKLIASNELPCDSRLAAVDKAINYSPLRSEQVKFFAETTGLSRRTFFYNLKKLKNNMTSEFSAMMQ